MIFRMYLDLAMLLWLELALKFFSAKAKRKPKNYLGDGTTEECKRNTGYRGSLNGPVTKVVDGRLRGEDKKKAAFKMTHILADREFPKNIRQRVEQSHNHRYLPGLNELQRRRRHGGITPEELDNIRSFSRQSWASECDEQDPIKSSFYTTYSSFHHKTGRSHCEGTQYRPQTRPSSPTRRNNPHPSRAFLTLKLGEAPGFEPNRVRPDQDPYRVGKQYEKKDIYTEKQLHYSTPNYQSGEKKIINKALSSQRIPVAQAWLKEATNEEKKIVMNMLESCSRFTTTNQEMANLPKVSMHRWLKKAGIEEEEALARLSGSNSLNPKTAAEINAKYIGKQNPNRYVLGKYGGSKPVGERYETEERITRRVPYRSEFLLHPELVP